MHAYFCTEKANSDVVDAQSIDQSVNGCNVKALR